MQKPYVLTYPIAFQNLPSVQATMNHGSGGFSSVTVDPITTIQCTFWAFWEGNTFADERFSYTLLGY